LYSAENVAGNICHALHRGEEVNIDSSRGEFVTDHGKAVQLDPIKPTLKAPGIKRLKLKYD
jgi:hypothetical protein